MKRQIKFRAWINNKMVFFDKGKGILTEGSTTNLCFYSDSYEPYNSKYELMQFTGLKDRNNKEIYEGDIVKLRHSWETKSYHLSDVRISFDGIALVEPHPKHTNGDLRTLQNFAWENDYCVNKGFATCEIVGNVFENLELIKDLPKILEEKNNE